MIWRTNLQPSPLCGNYLVQISYWMGREPETRVLCPNLKRRPGEPLPHTYPGERLCLYYPFANPSEWEPQMWLSETIYIWAALWLMFYETCLVTGIWNGGGIEHVSTAARRRK